MSRVTNMFGHQKQPASVMAPSQNREGYPAWNRPLEEQTLQVLMTNTFGNQYYADARTLINEAKDVYEKMLKKDSAFFAKALVHARNKGFMRTAPIFGLAMLAGVNRDAFKSVFDDVIRTPNDLKDFTTLVESMRTGQGGSAIKKTAAKWLTKKMNEYWAVKYGAEGRTNGYSLADLICVYHPNFGGVKSSMIGYLLDKQSKKTDKKKRQCDWQANAKAEEAFQMECPQLYAFERLKSAKTDKEKVDWITEGRLPHEVATSFAGSSAEVWQAIVPNMPIFALVRHLATLERHGIMDSVRDQVVAKISDRKAIEKSMMFPYRFLKACEHVHDSRVQDALRDAVDLSFVNVPEIEGTTTVMLDVSGSMLSMIDQAAIFAVAALKKSGGNGRFIQYNTMAKEVSFSMRDSVLTQSRRVHADGGTDTSAPMRKILNEKCKTDNILLITDEQQNQGVPFADVFEQYRRQVNKDTKLFILDVSSYRSVVTPDWNNVWYAYGWSDAALQFIGLTSRGWGSQVEAVRKCTAIADEENEEASPIE
jgi:60 kDa SS-A/Ro ribonucleoprotein